MAERSGFTSGARDLDFISVNPAQEAYNEQDKINLARKAAEIAVDTALQTQAENRASAPSRLRTITATSDLTRANADVAQGTVGSKISEAASGARTAGANADVNVGTAPFKIDDAKQNNRTTTSNANVTTATEGNRITASNDATRTGTAGADVAVATVPDKIATSRLGVRQAELNAANTELAQLKTQLDMIDAGRVDEAKLMASQTGRQIPQAVIDSAELRTTLKAVITEAEKRFPNRPRDQQAYIKAHMDTLAAGSSNPSSPMTPYTSPPGAPTPEEDVTASNSHYEIVHRQETDPITGQVVIKSYKFDRKDGELTPITGNGSFDKPGGGAGGSGHKSVYQQKLDTYRAAFPNDETGALAYASGRKQLGDADLQRAAASILNAKYPKPMVMNAAEQTKRNAAYEEILAALRASNNAPAAGPGATPPGANTPPPGLTGRGTKDAPFQATTQEHVDWFKTKAPPNTIILINGKPYTKTQ